MKWQENIWTISYMFVGISLRPNIFHYFAFKCFALYRVLFAKSSDQYLLWTQRNRRRITERIGQSQEILRNHEICVHSNQMESQRNHDRIRNITNRSDNTRTLRNYEKIGSDITKSEYLVHEPPQSSPFNAEKIDMIDN